MCFVPEQPKIGKIADSPEESGAALDFPCAHSMDTSWFAVDAEGNVGLFDTSEDGALPLAAFRNNEDPRERRRRAARKNKLRLPAYLRNNYYASEKSCAYFRAVHLACFAEAYWKELPSLGREQLRFCAPGAVLATQQEEQRLHPASPWSLKPCWVALAAEDGGRLDPKDCRRFVGIGPFLISRRPLATRTIQRIATTGTRLFDVYALYYSLTVIEKEANKVFCFGKEHGSDPGLYEREGVPTCPIKVDDLPWDVVSSLRLPVRFKDVDQVHLADFMKNEDAIYWGKRALRWADMQPD
jgi:hypothetical protein